MALPFLYRLVLPPYKQGGVYRERATAVKTVKHTDRIKALETAYWNEHHYLQVCIADPDASIADRKECLAAVKRAYENLVNAIWSQHRKQHGATAPIAVVRDRVKEWIVDNLNIRHNAQNEA